MTQSGHERDSDIHPVTCGKKNSKSQSNFFINVREFCLLPHCKETSELVHFLWPLSVNVDDSWPCLVLKKSRLCSKMSFSPT